jgi:Diguanylate cyclase, GGDEF domain
VSFRTHHHLTSAIAEPARRLGVQLSFGPFFEEEFRRHYASSHYDKTRPLLVALLALIAVSSFASLVEHELSWSTGIFILGVLVPTLATTLYLSYQERQHVAYQNLLAFGCFCVGMVMCSLVMRASLDGQSYFFGALVAWFFSVWLALGLLFSRAAVTAVAVSLAYGWGMVRWNLPSSEVMFSAATLVVVNLLGAYCSYQLEFAQRQSFVESRKLSALAERDGLTGLFNRRRYDDHINKVWRQSRREQDQFTMLLIDIDHFKSFNDVYGHQAGDDALNRAAKSSGRWALQAMTSATRFRASSPA